MKEQSDGRDDAAAVERVRDWLGNAGFPTVGTTSMYARGYNDAMADARSALLGEPDESAS